MVYSYVFDLKILFKKFYCPICGEKLKVVKEVTMLDQEQKELYYKKVIKEALDVLGNKYLALIMHGVSFPSCEDENTGFGTFNSQGAKDLFKYL